MTSGKSGLWCDANLSCLRISTPQKPWSPTAELKTCWPPMMDSRSRHLPALCSTAPVNPRQPWTSSPPRRQNYTGDPVRGSPSLLPTTTLPRILSSPSFQTPCILLPSDFCFLRFFSLFVEERECVCVSFSPSPHYYRPSYLPLFLPPACALTVNVEPGRTDATTLVPSFLLANTMDRTWKHRNWLRIVSWSLLGFLFCQREQKQNLLVRWKTRLSCHPLCGFFLLFFAQSNGHLVSAKTVVFFMFVSCFYLWL